MIVPRQSKRWELRGTIPSEVAEQLSSYPPFFQQILYGRGIRSYTNACAYLDAGLEVDDPYLLKGMQETVDRLCWAIAKGEQVAVYGDYDVDGVTATALLVQALRQFGATAFFYIPDREEEGYGLNMEALDKLAAMGTRLVVTVDCGIRSPREAERAEALGIDLIISDHHQPGPEIPDAFSVICPKQSGDDYPDKDLAGVGIAYKIVQALCRRMPEADIDADEWLDLVALGTVSDIAPLRGENRMLVRRGIAKLRRGSRAGISSLAGVARVKLFNLQAGDIAFMLGPRLNAAGRMESAIDSLRLLLADDVREAGLIAQQLDNQNRHRQDATRAAQEEAIQLAQEWGTDSMLFAFSESFRPGIVGLAASRLVDTYYRPAVVGEKGPEVTRASCRSIPEFNITAALDQCRDLLERHGGHAMAAGFTIRNENVPELIRRLSEQAQSDLAGKDLRPVLYADLEIPLSDLKPELLPYLDQIQPTGQENAEAAFISRDLRVMRSSAVGNEKQHLRLKVSDGRIVYDAIAFRQGHWLDRLPERVDLLYVYERNEFNGLVTMQLNVRDLKPAGSMD